MCITLLSSLVGCLCLPGLGGTDKRFLPFSSWNRSCSLTHTRGHTTDLHNYIPTPFTFDPNTLKNTFEKNIIIIIILNSGFA